MATVVVPDRQLSLAIGREGQNARLCARLSGLMVNIKSVTEAEEERLQRAADAASHAVAAETAKPTTDTLAEEAAPEVEAIPVEELIEEAAAELDPEAVPCPWRPSPPYPSRSSSRRLRLGWRRPKYHRRLRSRMPARRSRRYRNPCGLCPRWPSSRRGYDLPRTSWRPDHSLPPTAGAVERPRAASPPKAREASSRSPLPGPQSAPAVPTTRLTTRTRTTTWATREISPPEEGPLSRGHVPLRTCVVCSAKTDKRALVRIVRSPSGYRGGGRNRQASGAGRIPLPQPGVLGRSPEEKPA